MKQTTSKAPSKTVAIIHEIMSGLHKAGVIDREAMREFDAGFPAPSEGLAHDDRKLVKRKGGKLPSERSRVR